MTTVTTATHPVQVMVYTGLLGVGMGLSIPALLIAVQSTVPKHELGAATSAVQFSRSIGGTLGVSTLGVYLSTRLAALLAERGIDPTSIHLESLIDPLAASTTMEGPLRTALAAAIAGMFGLAFAASVAGLAATFFAPRGSIAQLEVERERKAAAEKSPETAPES